MTITCITAFHLDAAIAARMILKLPGVTKLYLIVGAGSLPVKLGLAELFKGKYPPGVVEIIPGIGSSRTFGMDGLYSPRVPIKQGFQYESIIAAIRSSNRVILMKDAMELLKLPFALTFPDQELWIATRTRLALEFIIPETYTHRRLVKMFPKRIVCIDIESFLQERKTVINQLDLEHDPILKMMCDNENRFLRDKIEDEASTAFSGFRQLKRVFGRYDRPKLNETIEKLAYLTYLIDHPYSGVIGAQVIPFIFTDEFRGNCIRKTPIECTKGKMETYVLKDIHVGRAYVIQSVHDCLITEDKKD